MGSASPMPHANGADPAALVAPGPSTVAMGRTWSRSAVTVRVADHTSPVSLVPQPQDVLLTMVGAARGVYVQAIGARLAAAGFLDLPRNGWFVLSGVAEHAASADDFARELGVTKQRASQLIRALVQRGYLQRRVDHKDRRRLDVSLTDRGRAAVSAVRAAVDSIDDELTELVSPAELAALRTCLVALTWIGERNAAEDRVRPLAEPHGGTASRGRRPGDATQPTS